METPPQTVAETQSFIASADRAGMTEEEREATVNQVAADPEGGDVIVGSGGVRKVRVAGRGKGKSGGYRVVTGYLNDSRPVYLFAVLSKGRRSNFTKAQIAAFKSLMDRLRRA